MGQIVDRVACFVRVFFSLKSRFWSELGRYTNWYDTHPWLMFGPWQKNRYLQATRWTTRPMCYHCTYTAVRVGMFIPGTKRMQLSGANEIIGLITGWSKLYPINYSRFGSPRRVLEITLKFCTRVLWPPVDRGGGFSFFSTYLVFLFNLGLQRRFGNMCKRVGNGRRDLQPRSVFRRFQKRMQTSKNPELLSPFRPFGRLG